LHKFIFGATQVAMTVELIAIEHRIIRAGKTLKDLLYHADIDGSLWYRWKKGLAVPRRSSIKRLQDAADKLAPEGTNDAPKEERI
jgi:hypothetical protein